MTPIDNRGYSVSIYFVVVVGTTGENMDLKNKLKDVWKNNKGFIAFIFCFLIFRSIVIDQYIVPSGSMLPNLQIGDRILVYKSSFNLRLPFTEVVLKKISQPQRGDIIIFNHPQKDIIMVKRLIGEPGDKLLIENGFVSVNGNRFKVTQLSENSYQPVIYFQETHDKGTYQIQRIPQYAREEHREIEVPKGHYFVMGDNRDNSSDSRFWGFVPEDELMGRAFAVFYSLDGENYWIPRWDRTFKKLTK